MILLSCLCTALTNTVAKKPKTPSQEVVERRGTEVINDQLKDMLPSRYLSLKPLIKSYNHAVRLTHTQREPRATERHSRLGTSLTSPHFSRLANKLIRDQMDLANILRPLGINIEGNNIIKRFSWIKPFCDKIDQMVDSIPDPVEQAKLQEKVVASKLRVQQNLDFPNTFSPRKVSPEKARKQKIQLMQFVNLQIENMYQVKSSIIGDDEDKQEDLDHYFDFATIGNIGTLCIEEEFNGLSADEILASIDQYSSLPKIDKKTAQQYAANHPKFHNKLAKGSENINVLGATVSDLLNYGQLPPRIRDSLDERAHGALEIGYELNEELISETDED